MVGQGGDGNYYVTERVQTIDTISLEKLGMINRIIKDQKEDNNKDLSVKG